MMDLQEYLDAGFTQAQAALLQRQFDQVERTSAQRFGLLQEITNRGFAEVQQTLRGIGTLVTAVDRRVEGVEHRFDGVERRLDVVEHRLDRIEGHLRRPPLNGGSEQH